MVKKHVTANKIALGYPNIKKRLEGVVLSIPSGSNSALTISTPPEVDPNDEKEKKGRMMRRLKD